MATEIQSPSKIPQALPPELHPDVEHLVTEDDTPVDNVFSEKQQRLLTEPLYSSPGWAAKDSKVHRVGQCRSVLRHSSAALCA